MKRFIDIKEIEKYYHVTEIGTVYSHVRKRWLKPQVNRSGYVFYYLTFGVYKPMWVFVHSLVAFKYFGAPPGLGYEVDHLDGDKGNNHYSNLRWVTHSENMMESFRRGQRGRNTGRPKGFHHSYDTRMQMADAKKKRVKFETDGGVVYYESIDDACRGLKTYRKRVYLSVKNNTPFSGGYLSYVDDEM